MVGYWGLDFAWIAILKSQQATTTTTQLINYSIV
jgi:hypothetical protein